MEDKEIAVVGKEVNGLLLWAQGLVVTNQEQYTTTYAEIKVIKGARKRWTDIWQPLKEKAHISWKALVAEEKKGTDVCDAAEKTAKGKADTWYFEQERKRQEEQRKLQAIADEKARRERERLEKEAANLKTPEKQAERLEQAAAVAAPVITVAPPAEKIKGVSYSVKVKARLVDMAALIAAATPGSVASTFLIFDQAGANKSSTTKNKVPVPGIEYFEERISAVRGEQ